MVFHMSLLRSLLSILANLNNAGVWMVSIHPPISNCSSPFFMPLGTVSNTPITIDITVTLMFHSYLISLGRYNYLFTFSFTLIFTLWFAGTAKSTMPLVLLFFLFFLMLINTRCGLLIRISGSVCISKSQ